MASIPGYCPRCKIAFESRGIWIENSFNVTLSNNKTNCPKCGGEARLVDGVFNERGRGLEIVSGPPATYAIIQALTDIAKRAESGEISARQAATEARQISPIVEKALARFSERDIGIVGLLLAIVALLTQCVNMQMDNSFQEELIERLDRQIEIMNQQSQLRTDRTDSKIKRDETITGGIKKAAKVDKVKTTKKSNRRAIVNKQRREELRARRQQFNPKL